MNKTKMNTMIDYYLCKLSIKESINDQIDIIKSHDYVDKDKIKEIKRAKKVIIKKFKKDFKEFKKKI